MIFRDGTSFSISRGAEDTTGPSHSVEEVRAALRSYISAHRDVSVEILTVWEMPPGGSAGTPHPASDFLDEKTLVARVDRCTPARDCG